MAGPRLLLFGMPGAGKSSLLGALAQAAPALKAELKAELIDASGAVQHLQEPTEKVAGPFSSAVTLLDSSGESALAMLQATQPFAESLPIKKLILDADAVLLVADVSLTGKQLTEQFRQFAHWLQQLHEIRGARTDIAELPIYFVLSKCDLLAKKDDTNVAWIKRIEEIKGKFDENFRKYLKMDRIGFGTLKLKLSATAIRHPAFTDKPARAQEPYGVAELFRECLQSAGDFQERRRTSQSRLQNIVVGLVGLVAMLGLSVFFLVEFQPQPRGTTLDEKVQTALPKRDATPLERLQGTSKKLKDKESKLTEIESEADFERLSAETRKAVTDYREELSQYMQLEQDAQTMLKLPHLAKNDAELRELEKTVQAFAFPEARVKDWADTRLGKRVRHVRKEYESLHAAIKDEVTWMQGQIEENRKLLKTGNRLYGKLLDQDKDAAEEAKDWQRQYKTQVNRRPPMPRDDNVPGVAQIVYEDLGKFEPLKTTHKAWRISKDDLTNIADLIQKKLTTG